jgi:hypothetical protein
MDEAAGACLCRRQGVQVGEIVAAAFAESAGGRAGQGVQALRLAAARRLSALAGFGMGWNAKRLANSRIGCGPCGPSCCVRTWYAGDAEALVAALKGLLEPKSVATAGGTKSAGA